MTLILLRHGATRATLEHRYCGRTDVPLLPAPQDGLTPMELPEGFMLVSSGMLRAEQTITRLFGPAPHAVNPALRETDFGAFEMRTYEELRDDPAFLAWCAGDNEANRCPGGESGLEITDRAEAALLALAEAGRDALVVTHGGVIGGVLARWFPRAAGRYAWTPRPGQGYTVVFEDGKPQSVRATSCISRS